MTNGSLIKGYRCFQMAVDGVPYVFYSSGDYAFDREHLIRVGTFPDFVAPPFGHVMTREDISIFRKVILQNPKHKEEYERMLAQMCCAECGVSALNAESTSTYRGVTYCQDCE